MAAVPASGAVSPATLTIDGQSLPITHWSGCDGGSCQDSGLPVGEALAAVGGSRGAVRFDRSLEGAGVTVRVGSREVAASVAGNVISFRVPSVAPVGVFVHWPDGSDQATTVQLRRPATPVIRRAIRGRVTGSCEAFGRRLVVNHRLVDCRAGRFTARVSSHASRVTVRYLGAPSPASTRALR